MTLQELTSILNFNCESDVTDGFFEWFIDSMKESNLVGWEQNVGGHGTTVKRRTLKLLHVHCVVSMAHAQTFYITHILINTRSTDVHFTDMFSLDWKC